MNNKTIAIIAVVVVVAIVAVAAVILTGNGDKDDKYVYYYANGGTSDDGKTSYQFEDTVCYGNNLFYRDGYVCVGWNTKANGSGTFYGEGANVMLGTKLYAQWESHAGPYLNVSSKNLYTSVFHCSVGSSAGSAVSIDQIGEYQIGAGYKIFFTPVKSITPTVDEKNRIRIDTQDGKVYFIVPSMSDGQITSVSVSGNSAVISFAYNSENPTFSYMTAETEPNDNFL